MNSSSDLMVHRCDVLWSFTAVLKEATVKSVRHLGLLFHYWIGVPS